MSGLISRLKEIIEKYNAGCYNETCNPFASCTDCVLKQIREVIESQPPANSGTDICVGTNQWIPCGEKNPSKPGYYEVTVKDGMGCRIRTMARYDITIKDWVTSTIHDDEVVVAWREPMPEPYKGE